MLLILYQVGQLFLEYLILLFNGLNPLVKSPFRLPKKLVLVSQAIDDLDSVRADLGSLVYSQAIQN